MCTLQCKLEVDDWLQSWSHWYVCVDMYILSYLCVIHILYYMYVYSVVVHNIMYSFLAQ